MFNTNIYNTAFAAAATLADVPVSPADQSTTIVNGHPIYPVPIQAILAYIVGDANITRAQLSTPKLRAINTVNLRPLDIAAAPTSRPPVVEYFHHPLSLNPIDENQILMSVSAAAAEVYAGVWYSDGNFNVPSGDLFTIHCTASLTTVAQGFVTGAITLDSPLPAGRYSVVGMDCYGTDALFGRLVFPNQVWRPGAICGQLPTFINTRYTRWGALGEWGQFETFALPQLEIYATAAAGPNTFDVFLDLIRVK